MADSASVELVRRLIYAFGKGDGTTLDAGFADDIRWHDGGRSPVSGDKHGKAEVLRHLQRLGELSNGTFNVDVHAVVGDAEHVVGLLVMSGERNGKTLHDNLVTVWHVAHGKVVDFWSTPLDQYAADDFWS
jgi:ketosteroid isomerase-like protein